MTSSARALTVLASIVLMFGASACGGDDEPTAVGIEEPGSTEPSGEEGEGEATGAPEFNPCAEGESGELGLPGPAPADGATPVTVTGAEYSFSGHEAMSSVGKYALTFRNAGTELHEIQIVKVAPDEMRPAQEIVQLPPEEAEAVTSPVAFAFACPGRSSEPVAVHLDEPGRYLAVCLVPVGVKPETDPAEFADLGPPHAAAGMVAELRVS